MIIDWFSRWAIYQPDKVAVEEYESGRAWTYAELNYLGQYLAQWLAEQGPDGIGKGDRVAILAENCLEYIALLAAAQKSGIILVPLNYRLTSHELNYMLGNSEPSLIISQEKFLPKLEEAPEAYSIPRRLLMREFQAICDAQTEAFRHKRQQAVTSPEREEKISFEGMQKPDENDCLFLIYTSGTTAFPKASIYTHRMLFWNSLNTELRLDITSNDRSINCAPPFHTGGWNVLLTPFLHHGAYTLIMKSFDPSVVLELLDARQMSIFWAVPTMLRMMMESPGFDSASLQSVRYFIVGGEAMPLPLIDQWHKKGVFIRQGYGLTEVGPNVTSLNHQDAMRKAGSIGTPNFYYEIRLVDARGCDAAPGEAGELLLKGPTVSPGYWKNHEATAETIVDGWFHTGDLGRRDEEGFLYVVDRIKHMYISGGENVYPAEIEYLLSRHPEVDAVAITGVPDEKWGESGMAWIVKKQGSGLTDEQVKQYCLDHLARYKVPQHVVFVDSLPRNDAGKIDRRALRERA